MLIGPAVGGLLIAFVGIGWCFVVDVVGLVRRDRAVPRDAALPAPRRDDAAEPARGSRDGIALRRRRRDLLGTYVVDIAAMFLAMPVVLFPALAEEVFDRPELLGLLYSAETVGALLATVAQRLDLPRPPPRPGDRLAAAAYGAVRRAAGLMPAIWLVALFLVLAGAADMISGIFRGTVWNQTIPEAMRGRLAGIEMLSYSVGPLAGQVRAGAVADLWSVRGAIVSGGVACVVGVPRRRWRCATSGGTTTGPTGTPWPSGRYAGPPAGPSTERERAAAVRERGR